MLAMEGEVTLIYLTEDHNTREPRVGVTRDSGVEDKDAFFKRIVSVEER
jgi:hypothetical protein